MHKIGEDTGAPEGVFDPLLHAAIEPLHEAPAPALRDPTQPLAYGEYLALSAPVVRPQFTLLQGGA